MAVARAARRTTATMSGVPTVALPTNVGTLVVQAPHEKGTVSSIAQLFTVLGATVLDSAHFSDPVSRRLFQRIQFDLGLGPDRDALERELGALASQQALQWRVCYGDRRKRVGILVSKQEHCLYDLLIRHRAGELACDIAVIVSNHADAASVAAHFNVPFHHVPVTQATKVQAELAAAAVLESAGVDLVVLARYMQILSPALVARFPHRIINVHHSFLPAFVGGNAYRQAHEKGVKMIGATSHYVTAELDQGPIIEQATIRCAHRDTVDDLVRKGRDLEKQVLAAAVRWHLEDRVQVHDGKTVVFD
ncbi:MAG: formyltetrahydrofolate deformylase [Deltaproteobacteria bacterium]|nr:formyltetrahydrofolate deformylase [Deltaproteobacteria bacterium]MCW5801054.1 formyltetrahydrofolate deformylase [Deltaproteobacteria bacterium]